MKVTFNIDYRTNWGESVCVTGTAAELGAGDVSNALKLSLEGEERWTATVDIPGDKPFEYSYVVVRDDGTIRKEWGKPRTFVPGPAPLCRMFDRWQDQPWDKPYYSSAFTESILHRTDRQPAAVCEPGKLTVEVFAPMVAPTDVVAIAGASKALGNWEVSKAVRMSDADYPLWRVTIDPTEDLGEGSEFKFLILNKKTGAVVSWEGGENRRLSAGPVSGLSTTLSGMRFINMQTPWHGAGTAIPVFSLRTEADFGVGEFLDLIPMIDWAASTGQTFIQILPINDTTMTGTWTDSYPYNANSTFALHPQYLRLSDVGKLKDAKKQKHYDQLAAELNALKEIDYERVNNAKRELAHELFAQNGAEVMSTPEYKDFVKRNEAWLKPYAAFCVLRDMYGTPEFGKWGEYAVYDQAKVDALAAAKKDAFDYECYIQYFLDKQMRQVRDYAHSKGVAIKGDIPIGISRTSVDAWMYPQLFYMDCQAGAPPDDFSVLGQNWGFPTYNWEEMSHDGFAWWKARFSKMSEYFDAYRIDHVLGFFRIWEIPMDALHGLLGHFNPALPFTADELRDNYDFWIDANLHTTPYIMDYFLGDFFGEYTDEVREKYLTPLGYGRYSMKDEFNTQRKVADYFAAQEKCDKNTRICDGLLALIDEVLFIPDPKEPWKFHPRISAQHTYIYRSLNDYERWCFDRLYNDFFYHRHNDFWYGKAMWKLPPLIDATDMLVCAEDLGMIPACVPAVMSALEIIALEIQRMPKDPNHQFGDTWHYPYYSVCTTSPHDMSGIRGWWEENRQATQEFYNNVLHEPGQAPYFAEPWVCERILDLHLKSPSMLCIIPLQDWLSMDGKARRENPLEEQINVPKNSRHYWRYRMHLTIEALQSLGDFNAQLRGMIAGCGR
ncbi:MAG: 4-alpha-glucanotransferase [Muribaculaceae bacterium]|nr:4-alpha-glucanotransferase [Muribaculaceae bacterium]